MCKAIFQGISLNFAQAVKLELSFQIQVFGNT